MVLLGIASSCAIGLFFLYQHYNDTGDSSASDESWEATLVENEEEIKSSVVADLNMVLDQKEAPQLEKPVPSQATQTHFEAVDEKGQPYTIDAKSAKENDGKIVELSSPIYTIKLNSNTVVTIESLVGFLDQDNKKLLLKGDVVVHYGNDYRFKSPLTHIDLRYGYAHGDESIQGEGGAKMNFTSGSYLIEERGNKVTLEKKPMLKFQLKG